MSKRHVCFSLAVVPGSLMALAGSALGAGSQAWTGSSDEVRALVSEVMADAETRSSLLATGSTAGYDSGKNKFFLASDDGAWRLNIGGYMQVRYTMNWRDDNGGDEDFESGFENRRTRLILDGKIATNVFYKIQADFSRTTGGFGLLDAYGGYKWDNGLAVQFGQFKLPFLREELVSASYQLAADRSLTNVIFSQTRSQGVMLSYDQDDWRTMLAFSDGLNSQNSAVGTNSNAGAASGGVGFFRDGFTRGGGESDWAITGRFEWKVAGKWDQFKDFTSMPGSEFALLLGVAGTVEQSDQNLVAVGPDGLLGTPDDLDGDTTLGGWTADLSIEGDGWNFYAAAIGHHVSNNLAVTATRAPADSSFDDYGFVVQGGFFIPNTNWELFARYDVSIADSNRTGPGSTMDDNFSTVTFGANYYLSGHAAKFTMDLQWFLDDGNVLSGPQSSIGYFQDLTDENEITVRLQFQFMF